MNARTSKDFASRAGYTLGIIVRFIAFDDQLARYWGKRLVLLALVSLALYFSFSQVAGTILNLVCIVLILSAISKVDTARPGKSPDIPTASHSRDVFDYEPNWLRHRVEYKDIKRRD